MVALAVIEQTLRRKFLQLMFQFGQVLGATHSSKSEAKYKVAKAEFLGKNPPRSCSRVGESFCRNE